MEKSQAEESPGLKKVKKKKFRAQKKKESVPFRQENHWGASFLYDKKEFDSHLTNRRQFINNLFV